MHASGTCRHATSISSRNAMRYSSSVLACYNGTGRLPSYKGKEVAQSSPCAILHWIQRDISECSHQRTTASENSAEGKSWLVSCAPSALLTLSGASQSQSRLQARARRRPRQQSHPATDFTLLERPLIPLIAHPSLTHHSAIAHRSLVDRSSLAHLLSPALTSRAPLRLQVFHSV